MSLIGKKVEYEYPVNNNKTEKGSGVILDKVRSAMPAEMGQTLTYDNYVIEGEDGKVNVLHPTLITKIIREEELN